MEEFEFDENELQKSREALKNWPDLPITGLQTIREIFEDATRIMQEHGKDERFGREWLFSFGLLGYYDAMHGGLKTDAGHVLYRLSDHVPEEERRSMEIYPSRDGSLTVEGNPWDSLEDWRRAWEKHYPFIPPIDFQALLKTHGKLLNAPETSP